jgi:hypothetical protein
MKRKIVDTDLAKIVNPVPEIDASMDYTTVQNELNKLLPRKRKYNQYVIRIVEPALVKTKGAVQCLHTVKIKYPDIDKYWYSRITWHGLGTSCGDCVGGILDAYAKEIMDGSFAKEENTRADAEKNKLTNALKAKI